MTGMAEEAPAIFVLACVSCGKTVSGSEDKCPRCGVSFKDACFECPFCGSIVSAEETRCSECGTEFSIFAETVDDSATVELDGPEVQAPAADPAPEAAPQEAVAEGPAEYECPSCGKPVGESDSVCPHCGARFSE